MHKVLGDKNMQKDENTLYFIMVITFPAEAIPW